eukprot:TRINITY_DN23853_c0_g1_i1.p1 TRINITY_DN23853_c0_g1~~TRINITY_DN23853_c0_g1_i1.p1  ORF type:complete len:158 (+),score=19.17 TRINITY_DN23853_c0_g1_i1:160-633(+)
MAFRVERPQLPEDGLVDLDDEEGRRRGQELMAALGMMVSSSSSENFGSDNDEASDARPPPLPPPPVMVRNRKGDRKSLSNMVPRSELSSYAAPFVSLMTQTAAPRSSGKEFHVVGPAAPSISVDAGVCWTYSSRGYCPRGANCRWRHEAAYIGFARA